MPIEDIWADVPAPEPAPQPLGPAPPWFWDLNRQTGDAVLRARDGTMLLAVIQQGESWGIFQLQRLGLPWFTGDAPAEWELIQIRADRQSAMAEALEGAKRAGLIES